MKSGHKGVVRNHIGKGRDMKGFGQLCNSNINGMYCMYEVWKSRKRKRYRPFWTRNKVEEWQKTSFLRIVKLYKFYGFFIIIKKTLPIY